MQTIIHQMKSLYYLFQMLQQSLKFDFSMFSKRQKQVFERKSYCSLSKKNSHYTNEREENQIIKNQAITTQSTLSMKEKIKSKPYSLLNTNENVRSNQ
jgi:hypothetical protein